MVSSKEKCEDTTVVIKYPMSTHLGCLIQTKSEKLWKVPYYKDTKMSKSKKTDNTMDKRNKGRIDKQPFIKHYGTQETNDRATHHNKKKGGGIMFSDKVGSSCSTCEYSKRCSG